MVTGPAASDVAVDAAGSIVVDVVPGPVVAETVVAETVLAETVMAGAVVAGTVVVVAVGALLETASGSLSLVVVHDVASVARADGDGKGDGDVAEAQTHTGAGGTSVDRSVASHEQKNGRSSRAWA